MKDGVIILNFAREGIVDDAAVSAAIKAGKVYGYVATSRATCSRTTSASSRCRTSAPRPPRPRTTAPIMVAEQVRDFLENGNIRNAVNFPGSGACRARPPIA